MQPPGLTPHDEFRASLDQAFACIHALAPDAVLRSGEPLIDHARGMASIVQTLNVELPALLGAALASLGGRSESIDRELAERFGAEVAGIVANVRKLSQLGGVGAQAAALASADSPRETAALRRTQVEALRKLLLAFAHDIRVVLIRLASRLQTLRYHAASRTTPAAHVARETLDIYAPLANRLGIWQVKWELEDLAFRFDDPDTYRRIARLLDEKRAERETYVTEAIERLQRELADAAIAAEVSGRPKHIYSIWRKMRGKHLDFSELYDVRAFRVIVPDVRDCYTVLGIVHHIWQPIPKEFDDYISRPKSNGYRSLHTVVIGDDGRAFEVQIRTAEMHHFAEYGVAAHWRYKEHGSTTPLGGEAQYDEKIAWLRQLLAWKDDVAGAAPEGVAQDSSDAWEQLKQASIDDHIYVLTPQARVIALPAGSTPVDFAYHLHSELGHRCRGARVDGAMVPLNTPLRNGQSVEIITVKQGGPSRDWLNAQLGYLQSPRARQKVRAWFNGVDWQESVASGRTIVEKVLQREGKTSVNLDELATKLGFKSPEDLFVLVGKDEFSLRSIEHALSDAPPATAAADAPPIIAKRVSGSSVANGASSGVLVVGVGALLTQLARCCRPAPPDEIGGFVTLGKGVSIHRRDCPSFIRLVARAPERVLQTAWSEDVAAGQGATVYPIDLSIEAVDRQGLLRDISEVFAREKINVIGVKTATKRNVAYMNFTVEVPNAQRLQHATAALHGVPGVVRAARRN